MLNRAIGIGKHIRVPEPEDAPSFGTQKGRPALIRLRRIDVLTAVKLYGQSCLPAGKVDDERCLDQLAGERRPVAGDAAPYRKLGGRGIVAKVPRPGGQL
jgi:hypothetical protein